MIALPQPGEVVGFATCTPVIGEVSAGSEGAIFVGLLRARGVGRQNSPGLGDILAAEAGKAGDRSAALRARPGRWSGAAPGLSHDPEGGGTRACPGSVSGPAGARHACASVNPE